MPPRKSSEKTANSGKFFSIDFGARLAETRIRMSRTQADIAGALGLAVSTYADLEAGKRVPGLERLSQIAEVLQTTPGYLITGLPTPDLPMQPDSTAETETPYGNERDLPAIDVLYRIFQEVCRERDELREGAIELSRCIGRLKMQASAHRNRLRGGE